MTVSDILYAIVGVIVLSVLVLLAGVLGGIAMAIVANKSYDALFSDNEREKLNDRLQ